jgi:hypothetical protein
MHFLHTVQRVCINLLPNIHCIDSTLIVRDMSTNTAGLFDDIDLSESLMTSDEVKGRLKVLREVDLVSVCAYANGERS